MTEDRRAQRADKSRKDSWVFRKLISSEDIFFTEIFFLLASVFILVLRVGETVYIQ